MAIYFDLPTELESHLRNQITDLDLTAKESLLVALYRQNKVTHYEAAQALELDRIAVNALLARHGVTKDLPTPTEIKFEAAGLGVRLDK